MKQIININNSNIFMAEKIQSLFRKYLKKYAADEKSANAREEEEGDRLVSHPPTRPPTHPPTHPPLGLAAP